MTILLAVRLRTTAEIMALHDARETAALHDARNANLIAFFESIDGDRIAKFEVAMSTGFAGRLRNSAFFVRPTRDLDRLIAIPLFVRKIETLFGRAWTTVTGTTLPSFQICVIFSFLPKINDIGIVFGCG